MKDGSSGFGLDALHRAPGPSWSDEPPRHALVSARRASAQRPKRGAVRFLVFVLVGAATIALAEPKRRKAPSPPPPKPAYVSIASITGEPALVSLGSPALPAALERWAPVHLAPVGEAEKDARAALTKQKAVGLELALRLRLSDAGALSAALVLSSYPEHVLKTEYRAEASGGPPTALVGPVIDQVVADLAKDQGWQPVR